MTFFGWTTRPFRRQRIAWVEHPTLLHPFANPFSPLLHVLLHFFRSHLRGGIRSPAINKEEFGHARDPFVHSTWGRPHGVACQEMTNEKDRRGQRIG